MPDDIVIPGFSLSIARGATPASAPQATPQQHVTLRHVTRDDT